MATSIGDTGAKFAALAFDATGTLYSVTGEQKSVTGGPASENSETLFTLDLGAGQPELVCALGNGDSGESLAFNPVDGLIYHGSGFFTPFFASEQVFEKFDPASFSCARTDIPLSDRTIGEVTALTFWQSADAFLWAQSSEAENLFSITPSGEVALIGPMDHKSKGLAFRSTGTPVPALAPWALVLLAGAVGGAGIALLRRPRTPA